MAEKKNFLMLAIGVGSVCAIIGGITIWNMLVMMIEP